MKAVSIRELHTRTGYYVRAAAREPLAVTERGETIARIVPVTDPAGLRKFADRRLRPGFKRLQSRPFPPVDSGRLISEDRDRA
jgi:prevent-host-death family protein